MCGGMGRARKHVSSDKKLKKKKQKTSFEFRNSKLAFRLSMEFSWLALLAEMSWLGLHGTSKLSPVYPHLHQMLSYTVNLTLNNTSSQSNDFRILSLFPCILTMCNEDPLQTSP